MERAQVSDHPATAVQVASLLLGQADATLGNSTTLEPGDFKPRNVLQTNMLDNPSAGEMITLHLRSERATEDFPLIGVPTPIAELEFGMGSERNTKMLLDFDQGTQISFPAGSLRLTARMPEDVLALDSVECGAFIARGTRAGGACCSGPHFTIRNVSPDNAFIPIPIGAKNLTVWDLANPTTVFWLNALGMALGSFIVDSTAQPPPGPVNVPPTARTVLITGPHSVNLVFGLEG